MLLVATVNEWLTATGLGIATLAALVLVAAAGVGLFQARSLVRREFLAYFFSPVAWFVLAVFLIGTGASFYRTYQLLTTSGPEGVEFPLQAMYGNVLFWSVMVFLLAMLTMRTFAEERGSGTLEVLLTAPVTDWQVVLSKFAAVYAFYLVLWLPTLLYLPTLLGLKSQYDGAWDAWAWVAAGGLGLGGLSTLSLLPRLGTGARLAALIGLCLGITALVGGAIKHFEQPGPHVFEVWASIDPSAALTFYAGVALAGAMFLALGLFISSLFRDQLVAGLTAFALGFLFIVVQFFGLDIDAGGTLYRTLYYFAVPQHFERSFTRGMIDPRNVVLYLSVTWFFLFLTVRSLESRRWR